MTSNEAEINDKSSIDNWNEYTLGNITKIIGGGTPSTKVPSYWNGNIPWITPKDLSMQKSKYIEYGGRNITKNGLINSNANLIPPNSIILSTRAPIGYIAISRNELTTNQGCHTLIPSDNIDTEFLYYLLKKSVEFLKSQSNGSTFGELSSKTLKEIKFLFPPLKEQKAIAKILSDLDAKIELDQKMNKTLEAIAKAIFKHWFIDFEFPNEEGKPYKSSGGEMVDSELGEIPKGWEVKKLLEVGTLKNGINYTREERGEKEIYIVNVRDVANNKFIIKDDLAVIKLNPNKYEEYLLNQNDIVIARSASPGESSLILGDIDNVIHSGFTIRYRLDNSYLKLYMYMILQNSKNILSRYSVGTALKSVNQATIGNIQFIMPTIDILIKFNSNYIFNKIGSNLLESKALFTIRDFLLPKLMSGKIRVPVED